MPSGVARSPRGTVLLLSNNLRETPASLPQRPCSGKRFESCRKTTERPPLTVGPFPVIMDRAGLTASVVENRPTPSRQSCPRSRRSSPGVGRAQRPGHCPRRNDETGRRYERALRPRNEVSLNYRATVERMKAAGHAISRRSRSGRSETHGGSTMRHLFDLPDLQEQD